MDAPAGGYAEAFKRLYYHLYSNSSVSRAERLAEDLSLLLLTKLAVEVNGARTDFDAFLDGDGTAESRLLPHLRSAIPELVDGTAHFALDDRAVRESLSILDEVSISQAPAHALGDAFQAFIGPRLRGERGQFFTPRTLVRAMVEVLAPQPHESILDPACGTGGFLLEVVAFWASATPQPTGHLLGIDKDAGLARLAAAVLKIAYGGGAEVIARNSLDRASSPLPRGGVDVVLTNPPFGSKIGITDARILESFDFGHRWRDGATGWKREDAVVDTQDPQVLFLELCVDALKAGGRLGIVLPEGVFGNKKAGYIWDWLRTKGRILALLDCPRTAFQPGTDTKTNVLFFQKGGKGTTRVPVAVALQCGHDRRGRTTSANGQPFPDDFGEIGADFARSRSRRKWWREVELTEPYYLVPRFYVPPQPRSDAEAQIISGSDHATLGQLVDDGLIDVRKGVEVGSEAYGTGPVPFVRTSDISNFEINIDPTKSIDDEIYERVAPSLRLAAGDVLMVVDGRYRIGASALLTKRNARCVVQSHVRIIGTPKRDQLDPYALLFALNLPSVRVGIRNLVFIQSTLGTLGARFYRLEIPILMGDGPWSQPLEAFRRSLTARDEELARLREIVGQLDDVEL